MDNRGLPAVGRFTVFVKLKLRIFFTQIVYSTAIFIPKNSKQGEKRVLPSKVSTYIGLFSG
jgi:hypothetical protein